MRNVIFLTILLIFCAGCASQEPAPIEFNTDKHYTNKEATVNSIGVEEAVVIKPLPADRKYNNTEGFLREKQPTEAPLVIPGVIRDNKKVIYHEVQPGETLEDLVENYSSPKEEIIEINDLIPPYKLEEFQILKIKVTNDILNKRNREQAPEIIENRQPNVDNLVINNNYIKPLDGTIITKFGEVTKSGKSTGINIEAREGTPVKSIANGTVIRAGNSTKYGNLVIIKLNDINLFVAYANLEGLILKADQKIAQGDIVGYVGSSGNVDKAQLHFAIKDGEKAVDPLKYIPDLDS